MGAIHLFRRDRKPAARAARGWFADWDHELLRPCRKGSRRGADSGQGRSQVAMGRVQQAGHRQPVIRGVPWISGYFQIGPIGGSGSSTTVKQTSVRVGPSMRMVVDFGDPQGGLLNIPIGQSGHPLSSHFKDQWDAYSNARSFPMHFPSGWQTKATLTAHSMKKLMIFAGPPCTGKSTIARALGLCASGNGRCPRHNTSRRRAHACRTALSPTGPFSGRREQLLRYTDIVICDGGYGHREDRDVCQCAGHSFRGCVVHCRVHRTAGDPAAT